MQIIINSVVCACALAGLIFGLVSFFKKSSRCIRSSLPLA